MIVAKISYQCNIDVLISIEFYSADMWFVISFYHVLKLIKQPIDQPHRHCEAASERNWYLSFTIFAKTPREAKNIKLKKVVSSDLIKL